jgi:hypothetical protein
MHEQDDKSFMQQKKKNGYKGIRHLLYKIFLAIEKRIRLEKEEEW